MIKLFCQELRDGGRLDSVHSAGLGCRRGSTSQGEADITKALKTIGFALAGLVTLVLVLGLVVELWLLLVPYD
jgi:hypothetical protein